MKCFIRCIKSICFFSILLLISGCFNDVDHYKVKDFFPIEENNFYKYEGKGNEYAEYNVYIDYTSNNKVQRRINNGGTVGVEVLEIKDGSLVRIFQQFETYFIKNYLDDSNTNEILLMEPIKKGTEWNVTDGKRSITEIDIEVSTPYGNYKAIEVTTVTETGENKDYYVKGVGHIKSVFSSEGSEVESSLKEITNNTSLNQEISFYYPSDSKVYYKLKKISFNTNDDIINIIEAEYKKPLDNLKSPLSSNSKINKIVIEENFLIIDLNKNFIEEMNAGSTYESLILKSIVNTFGQYYQREKVIINIDQQAYVTGHFAFRKDEYVLVDLTNTELLK